MPLSKAQLRWANTPSGHAALGDARVKQWDQEARGLNLPERSKGGESARRIEGMIRPLKGKNG